MSADGPQEGAEAEAKARAEAEAEAQAALEEGAQAEAEARAGGEGEALAALEEGAQAEAGGEGAAGPQEEAPAGVEAGPREGAQAETQAEEQAGPGAKVVVCVGPGGVANTTTPAALALRGARAGSRACVVTIDPARRLADALGVTGLGNEPHLVVPADGDEQWPGELWAVMLDAQGTFDDLVGRYATNPDQADTILANPVYRNISAAMSGTQEYMAVEKLYELQESGAFDLIVVDTPPAQHALDFLEAPKHLERLLDNRIFRLLMTPTRAGLRALEMGAQLVMRTIAKVAGGQVVAEVIQFFTQFEGMEEGFRSRADHADALLRSKQTSFILVCSPRRDTVEEALYLASELAHSGAEATTVVVNRCSPRYVQVSPASATALVGTPLEPLVTNLEQLDMVAGQEEEQLARVSSALPRATVLRVPFLTGEVSDLRSLSEVADHLGSEEVS
jgi:anion-transporting  ArsA/GET3 family ATPase